MKIVIAPDAFKESLTAKEVAQAIQTGFTRVFPEAEFELIPMADGGEGTVQSLIDATGGHLQKTSVISPLALPTEAIWGLSGDKKLAMIEMSAASGLHLVPRDRRNPLYTTSFGTGELIKAALNAGVESILLGIGGSATNDAGVGMLQALGAKFINKSGKEIGFGGLELLNINHIDLSQLDPRLQQVQIEVACDVTNPLCGKNGASAVFGPQKGATPGMVKQLDQALSHFANIVQMQHNRNIAECSGSGAAGGMGAGLQLLPNVQLKSGVEIVIGTTQLAKEVQMADLVITSEGRMDAQSIAGKTPIGVANVAKQFGKPVIAIVGCLSDDYSLVYQHGIDAVFPIIRQLGSLEQTLSQGQENLVSSAENIARLWKICSQFPK